MNIVKVVKGTIMGCCFIIWVIICIISCFITQLNNSDR